MNEGSDVPDERRQLECLAAEIARSGRIGRSSQVLALFDFLVQRAFDERTPKEMEIAAQVFGKTPAADNGFDASVRVYAHRLRKKLDEYQKGKFGPKLVLQKGEYRLILVPEEEVAAEFTEPVSDPSPGGGPASDRRGLMVGLGGGIAAMLAGGLLYKAGQLSAGSADPRADGFFWSGLTRADFPTSILVGDRFPLGSRDDNGANARPMRRLAMSSRSDLGGIQVEHSGRAEYGDVHSGSLPEGAASALTVIAPIVRVAVRHHGEPPQALTMSRFAPDMLNRRNLVYVGWLSDMRALQGPAFYNSGFQLDSDNYRLIDKASGKVMQADFVATSDDGLMREDYGYLSSFPGPRGNRILVIAGTHDPALVEMAKIVGDEQELAKLAAAVDKNESFEALFQVFTLGPSNVDNKMEIVRRLEI